MTTNQLRYHEAQETKRSNLAKEMETNRANLAKEAETARANLAREAEARKQRITDTVFSALQLPASYASAGGSLMRGLSSGLNFPVGSISWL